MAGDLVKDFWWTSLELCLVTVWKVCLSSPRSLYAEKGRQKEARVQIHKGGLGCRMN
jgi:hypothetical protein